MTKNLGVKHCPTMRNAAVEVHSSQALADHIQFHISGRLDCPSEGQLSAIRDWCHTCLNDMGTWGNGEVARSTVTVPADCRFGNDTVMEVMSHFGLSSVFSMAGHVIPYHPFTLPMDMMSGRVMDYNVHENCRPDETERDVTVGPGSIYS